MCVRANLEKASLRSVREPPDEWSRAEVEEVQSIRSIVDYGHRSSLTESGALTKNPRVSLVSFIAELLVVRVFTPLECAESWRGPRSFWYF